MEVVPITRYPHALDWHLFSISAYRGMSTNHRLFPHATYTFPFDPLGTESNSSKVRTCALKILYESLTKSITFKLNSQKVAWFKDLGLIHIIVLPIITEQKIPAQIQSINEHRAY